MCNLYADSSLHDNMQAMIAREQLTQILNGRGQESNWIDSTLLAHFERLDPRLSAVEPGMQFIQQVEANCTLEGEDPITVQLPPGEDHGGLFVFQRQKQALQLTAPPKAPKAEQAPSQQINPRLLQAIGNQPKTEFTEKYYQQLQAEMNP